MSESTLIASTEKLTRQQLALIPTPAGTATHRPVPHAEVVEALVETLGFRHIGVVKDEYAISKDGMKMFGLIELDQTFYGGTLPVEGGAQTYSCRFAIGIRNSHDKSMRLAMTVGYRVFVCENMAFQGDFQPVLAKHSKHFSLQSALAVGVDEMQRSFEPMARAVQLWRESQITDVAAKLIIYRAFIESEIEIPKHLARVVHENYFNPQIEDFRGRTLWSLSNAFTSAFKQLEPIPQFRATAKLAGFLERS
jgi:hypothetical protein